MQVGILGSGEVGKTLAAAFKSEGNNVMIATRDQQKESIVKWKKDHADISVGSFKDTARFGEILVLAVDGSAAKEVIKQSGLENIKDKIVIDCTNPIKHDVPPDNGLVKFFTSLEDSLMESLQELAPDAKFVKAFNSVGNTLMYKPALKGGKPSMFICGNDNSAKKTVEKILTDFGWETEDMGNAIAARAIEPLCILWCIPGFLQNDWTHAFKLLKQ